MIILHNARADVSWAQLDRLGDEGQLGRYALHFHILGEHGANSTISNSSITRSSNRFVSIHASNGVTFRDNVGYDCIGHGFYLQDGTETGNIIMGNLGLITRKADPDRLLSAQQPIFDREPNSEESEEFDANFADEFTEDLVRPSTFWANNLDNQIEGNAAAGSEGNGFWLLSKGGEVSSPQISYNRAHSNALTGIFSNSRPRFFPPARVFGWTAYKNRQWGAWLRSSH